MRSFLGALSIIVLVMMEFQPATCQMSRRALTIWQDYVKSTGAQFRIDGKTYLQNQCMPRSFNPILQPGEKARGTVLLYPSFGACPDEYSTLFLKLVKMKYNVVIPTAPGVGLSGSPNPQYYKLPTDKWTYEIFVGKMNQVILGLPSPRYVVGTGFGGTLALHHAGLQNGNPNFLRVITISPFLGTKVDDMNRDATDKVSRIINYAKNGGIAQSLNPGPMSYLTPELGKTCELARRSGRSGLCNYRGQHYSAIVDFAASVRTLLMSGGIRYRPSGTYFMYTKEKDSFSDEVINRRIAEKRAIGYVKIPPTVDHSALHKHPLNGQTNPWRCGLADSIVEYISKGTLPTGAIKSMPTC